MADFISLNEFIERTATAKIDQHIETLKAGVSRLSARKKAAPMGMLAHADALKGIDVSDLKSEFDKMKKFVLKRYEYAKSVHTFLDADGNFVDCIGFDEQQTVVTAKAAGHKVLARAPEPAETVGDRPPAKRPLRPVQPIASPLSQGLTDSFGNTMTCPEGAVPMRRITISQLARFGTFERFFQKFPGKSFPLATSTAMPSASDVGPDGYVHRHAIVGAPFTGAETYFGCTTFLNLWGPDPSPGEMHLSQTWIIGTDPAGASPWPDTIESGWQVSPMAWGTKLPVLFVFFNPDGYGTRSPQGKSRCGYGVNQFGEGFIAFPNTKWVANSSSGGFSTLSTPGGPQKGFYMQWQRDKDGNWILYCGPTKTSLEGVGYFPSNLYSSTFLGMSARLIQFGGEVASKNPAGTGPMGSGVAPSNPATGGFGTVAFQKEISVQTSLGQAMVSAPLTASDDSPSYHAIAGSSTNPNWGRFFFYGGASGPL